MNKKSIWATLILSILILGTVKGKAQNETVEQQHRAAAVEAINDDRYRDACDHLQIVLKINPGDEKVKEAYRRLNELAEKQEQNDQLARLSIEKKSSVPKNYKEDHPEKYRAFNTPVNYNFAQITFGTLVTDGTDYLVLSGGGEGMINENWIFDLSYRGYIFDTGADNFITLGINYRQPITEKLDIVFGTGVTYGWYKYDTYYYTVTGDDLGLLLDSSLRCGFTEEFEGSLEVSFLNIYDSTLTSISGSLSYYPTTNFGLGASIGKMFNDGTDGTTIVAHIRLNFD